MEIPQKTKIVLPYDPAVSLPGTHLDKTIIQKDTSTPMFIEALFTIATVWKQPCPLTGEWVKKIYMQWNTTQP